MLTKASMLFCSLASLVTAQEATMKTQVYLFAGQSNMDGRADAAKISAADLQRLKAVQDRIEFAYNWKPITSLAPIEASDYVKKKFDLEKSFGPEIFFGIALAEANPNKKFLFIKRAVGGTSLYGCWNPDWTLEKATFMKEEKQPKLYHDFIKYADSILAKRKPDSYEIKAMLWVQGEADSLVKQYGPIPGQAYEANLKNLIRSVRKHYKQGELPFLFLKVGFGEVEKAMNATASSVPNVSLIPLSQDKASPYFYPSNPPPLWHYTTEGMKRIGLNFYKTYAADYVKSADKK